MPKTRIKTESKSKLKVEPKPEETWVPHTERWKCVLCHKTGIFEARNPAWTKVTSRMMASVKHGARCAIWDKKRGLVGFRCRPKKVVEEKPGYWVMR